MIYLLDDEYGIRNFVLYALQSCGMEAEGFELPSQFWAAMDRQTPDLLLLDIMLPEEDGISILRRLRSNEQTRRLPVIMLSAKGSEPDKVEGLDSGADDYIAKPFGTMELISRIKAVLRRSERQMQESPTHSTAGGITMIPANHEVYANGVPVALTLKEYDLLNVLLENKGQVFSRDTLLKMVWGYDFSGESRTVDVHIRTLRSKLGECGDMIETVRGVGYKIGGSR
ncbi:MAG: response regulator transcription factor [Ruminococcus sp.]|nr:response regulator transcription factor [Ruminococcus sp.]